MADFHYGGTEDESAEIRKLNAEVVSVPIAFGTNQLSVSDANMLVADGGHR